MKSRHSEWCVKRAFFIGFLSPGGAESRPVPRTPFAAVHGDVGLMVIRI